MGTTFNHFTKLGMLLLLLVSACGPIAPLGPNHIHIGNTNSLSAVSDFDGEIYGRCQTDQAVTPEYDSSLDGSGYFSVCPSSSNPAGIVVFGEPLDSNKRICVFPAEVVSTGGIYPKIDGNGFPMLKCGENQSAGQGFVFERTSYNALFVVPYQDRNAMQICLATGNYFNCPKSYSYGKFR
jgi:hypothetical protein